MRKLTILFLFLCNILYSQTIYFNIFELTIIENGNLAFSKIDYDIGYLKYDLRKKTVNFETDFNSRLFIIEKIKRKKEFTILYCNDGYNFIIYDNFFILHKLFIKNENRALFEQKYYYTTKKI